MQNTDSDALSQDQAFEGSLDQQAPSDSDHSEQSEPEVVRYRDQEITSEQMERLLSLDKGYTQKFQEVAELRKTLEADAQGLAQLRQYQELATTPEGRQQLRDYLAQQDGIEPDYGGDEYDDDLSPTAKRMLTQLQRENAEMKKGLSEVQSHFQRQTASQQAEAKAMEMFGRPVSYKEMAAAVELTGIKDPVGAYAAYEHKAHRTIIDQARVRTQAPITPGGTTPKVFKITANTSAIDIERALAQGLTVE